MIGVNIGKLFNPTQQGNIASGTIPSSLLTGIVSYYKFDENTGSSVGDAAGANTGTWNGTLGSQWTTGKINSGGNFDGTDNSISLGSDTSLAISIFTFACWINIPSFTGTGAIICSNIGGNGGYEFRYNTSSKIELLKSNVISIGASTGTISINTWTHVAITYDASGNYIFYINGSSSGSGTNLQSFSLSNYYIGRQNVNEWFNGKLDEFGIWSRVLTSSEVTTLYNSGAGKQYPF